MPGVPRRIRDPRLCPLRQPMAGLAGSSEVNSLKKYLKNSVPEIKAVFDLLETHKMDPAYREAAYNLLKTMADRWPPKDEAEKLRFAKNIALIRQNIPEMEQAVYDQKLSTILKNTWSMSVKQVETIATVAFNIGRILLILGLVGAAAFGVMYVYSYAAPHIKTAKKVYRDTRERIKNA
jgi:hypothetical protein